MWRWCHDCMGVGGGATHPLSTVHSNLRLKRSISSPRLDDSQGSDDEVERQDGVISYEGEATRPSIIVVQVQPSSKPMHRPDVIPGDTHAIYPIYGPSSRSSSPDTSSVSSRSLDTLNNSPRGSENSLESIYSRHNNTSVNYFSSEDAISTESLPEPHLGRHRVAPWEWPRSSVAKEWWPPSARGHSKFLSPEEAARPPPQEGPQCPAPRAHISTRLIGYPTEQATRWPGKQLFSAILGRDSGLFAGQYTPEGSSSPIQLRGSATVGAIADYESRVDMKNSQSPAWYTFGLVVVALRHLPERQELEVDLVQVTQLPPGKEHTLLDFQVGVLSGSGGGRSRHWIRKVAGGPSDPLYTYNAKCHFKVRSLRERSLVVSAFVSGGGADVSQPHRTLGHGLVPNMAAQHLTSANWRTFPINLRHGSQVQNHLGLALVALSCVESSRVWYAFTADVTHVRNVKVQRLGHNVANSCKARAEIWVRAVVVTEGKQKKYKMGSTSLERPNSLDEQQGWEAIFERGCTVSFSLPKDKVHLSCLILEVHGRARHGVASREALLGKVTLGPEELFGGELAVSGHHDSEGVAYMSVPGDPLDARLTHWGQAVRRKAKVELWHRLQI